MVEKIDGKYIVEGFGLALSVYDAGQFPKKDKKGNDTDEMIQYEKGIKVTVGNYSVKLTAMQAAVLAQAFKDDNLVKELQKRFVEERNALHGLGFE